MANLIKINKELVLKILSKGLGYPCKKIEKIGEVIILNPRQALSYAIITSHGYLDENEPDCIYRLTRENFRTFNQANEYNLKEGVFSLSDLRLVTTINNEIKKRSYLKNNDKFILPIEYSEYNEFKKIISELITQIKALKMNPNDFIITPIRNSKSGISEFESFFEYVVSIYFNRMLYLTDTQIPFFYGRGTPDIAAYIIVEQISLLKKHGFLEHGGSVIDLMSLSSFGFYKEDESFSEKNDQAIVFEVKTNQLTAPQIQKYTETKIFNKAYEVIPAIKNAETYAGLFTVDKNGKIIIYKPKSKISFKQSIQQDYFNWISVYLKIYILANLETSELENMIKKAGYDMSISGIVDFTKNIEFEKFLITVKKIITRQKNE